MLSYTNKIKFIALCVMLFNYLFGLMPNSYQINPNNDFSYPQLRLLEDNLADDSVVDLRFSFQLNGKMYGGTSAGLSLLDYSDIANIEFSHFVDSNLPDGGSPSIITYDLGNGQDLIVVSGVASTNDGFVYGTGIAWSQDSGNTWRFTEQPVEEIPDCESITPNQFASNCSPASNGCTYNPNYTPECTYQGSNLPFYWPNSSQTLYVNPITTQIYNISYDISVDIAREYIYIASWAGMLRRIKYNIPGSQWELVPLPLDNDLSQPCIGFNNSYVYNPVDPIWSGLQNSGGNHNHKAYSVHVEGNVIWVGTASGVNKGSISGACIDWTNHYNIDICSNNFQSDCFGTPLSGDWVVDVVPQDIVGNPDPRIWLISWDLVSPPTPHGLTYSDDGGDTWTIVNQFNNPEDGGTDSAIVYNLYFDNTDMFAATNKGLYHTTLSNEQTWSLYSIPEDCFEDTERVFSYINDGFTEFVGTPNGLIYTCQTGQANECEMGWCLEEYSANNPSSDLGIYPNPANSFTNFKCPTSILTGKVDIFNFAMEQVVYNISCSGDGINLECDYDNINLSNGVYFCRLTYGNSESWGKLMVINSQ